MTRHYLTNHQKHAIQKEIRRRRSAAESTELRRVAEWAKASLKLPFLPSHPVLSRLSKTNITLPDNASKKAQNAAQPVVEERLATWINDQNNSGRFVTGEIIREKGKRLLGEVNAKLRDDQKLSLGFTKGWLWNFQRRWNLKARRMHGEAADADDAAVSRELPRLVALCQQFDEEDIFNADETGVNYCMPPDTTICQSPIRGRKKVKKRLTLLVCANTTGSEKFPLMFIGNAMRPRCFKKKSGRELGFDYWANSKSWMTMSLFFQWLLRFDTKMTQRGRKVLLLLDNLSGHGRVGSLPELISTRVEFLPPNTTSKLQPMDAGIIASLKRRYCTIQYNRVLYEDATAGGDIYAIDQLTAMRYLAAVWNDVPASVFVHCWASTGLLGAQGPIEASNNYCEAVDAENVGLRGVVEQLVSARCRMSINNLINADDTDVTEDITDEAMSDSVVSSLNFEDGHVGGADSVGSPEPSLPLRQQMEAIRVVMRTNELDEFNLRLHRDLSRLLRSLKLRIYSGQRQSTIKSFFKP